LERGSKRRINDQWGIPRVEKKKGGRGKFRGSDIDGRAAMSLFPKGRERKEEGRKVKVRQRGGVGLITPKKKQKNTPKKIPCLYHWVKGEMSNRKKKEGTAESGKKKRSINHRGRTYFFSQEEKKNYLFGGKVTFKKADEKSFLGKGKVKRIYTKLHGQGGFTLQAKGPL